MFVTNSDWFDFRNEQSSLEAFANAVLPYNGISVFVVYSIGSMNGISSGAWTIHCGDVTNANSYGVVVTPTSGALAFAHELGHACGLEDIYRCPDATNLTSDVDTALVRSVLPADIPADWPGFSWFMESGGNLSWTISKLLMHGVSSNASQVIIPCGTVVGRGSDNAIHPVSVGLNGLSRTPRTKGGTSP